MTQHKILVLNNSRLEEQHGTPMIDKNLRETIMWAAVHQRSLVNSFQKHYKLSDKQVWRWVVDGLADAGEWDHLEHFGLEDKAPNGYLALIKVLMKHGQRDRALKFMNKIAPTDQVLAYELIG